MNKGIVITLIFIFVFITQYYLILFDVGFAVWFVFVSCIIVGIIIYYFFGNNRYIKTIYIIVISLGLLVNFIGKTLNWNNKIIGIILQFIGVELVGFVIIPNILYSLNELTNKKEKSKFKKSEKTLTLKEIERLAS